MHHHLPSLVHHHLPSLVHHHLPSLVHHQLPSLVLHHLPSLLDHLLSSLFIIFFLCSPSSFSVHLLPFLFDIFLLCSPSSITVHLLPSLFTSSSSVRHLPSMFTLFLLCSPSSSAGHLPSLFTFFLLCSSSSFTVHVLSFLWRPSFSVHLPSLWTIIFLLCAVGSGSSQTTRTPTRGENRAVTFTFLLGNPITVTLLVALTSLLTFNFVTTWLQLLLSAQAGKSEQKLNRPQWCWYSTDVGGEILDVITTMELTSARQDLTWSVILKYINEIVTRFDCFWENCCVTTMLHVIWKGKKREEKKKKKEGGEKRRRKMYSCDDASTWKRTRGRLLRVKPERVWQLIISTPTSLC